MLNRRSFTRGLLAASSASLAAPYVRAATPDLPSTIRFGDVGFGFGAPFGEGTAAIAEAKGFIADEFAGTNVKTEFTYFIGTGPAINEAISNRQLDFASYGAVPNVIGKANGLPTTILASYGGTNIYAAVRPDLPIASVADLKGRKIAVLEISVGRDVAELSTLLKAAIPDNDIHVRTVGDSSAAAKAMGISVDFVRFLATTAGGFLAGIGGAFLSLYYPGSWNQGLSSGQGLMAVALVIFARWSPLRCVVAALLFGAAGAIGPALQSVGITQGYYFFNAAPYILTLLIMTASAGSKNAARDVPGELSITK